MSLAIVLALFGLNAQADLVLAKNGQSPYRIVIATNAIPSERYAAEELQRYLQKVSGAKLPIITDVERLGSSEIVLGENAHLRQLHLSIDFAKLGPEGYALRTDKDRLIIVGGRPRGTLYGVYALLEEKLGVRWFTPELEVTPHQQRLSLPSLDETRVPVLEYREVYWTEMLRDADFAARHRLNGNNYKLTDKHGGRGAVYFPFVHSLDSLIPRSLFATHPEYFPLINGKRQDGYVQRCLSNPEVVKLAIIQVRQWIQQHPEASIISVSQNDADDWCQCDQCKAFDDQEGSPAASLLRFVNAVAQDIERDYPHVRIDTLAYQYTRKPPKTLRPRPNVIIRLCSIECCFAHPLADCPSSENRRFRDDILAWQPVAPLLYVWDYTPNFAHYQQPFPNFDALQPNVRFFAQHGVKGLFEEGNYSTGGGGEMEPLRSYLLAKLLWDPDTDLKRHTREFLDAYYGKAAPKIQAYLDLLEQQVRDGKAHAHIFDPPTAAYLNDAFVAQADKLLDQAEQQAENDTIRFRVQVARLPLWYVQIATNQITEETRAAVLRQMRAANSPPTATDDPRTLLVHQFLALARKAGITHISESETLDHWAAQGK